MVIAEAMACAVPVVISDRCGIAPDVAAGAGDVLSVDAAVADWAAACERQLDREAPPQPFVRGWQQVAREQLAIYRPLAAPQRFTG
jgi:glycosyltransferase involved in cell wall biosynthesis